MDEDTPIILSPPGGSGTEAAAPGEPPTLTGASPDDIAWLLERSMLRQAKDRSRLYSGDARLWQQPFANTRPRDATAIASVWFTAYPASVVTGEGRSAIEALGDVTLWQALSSIGVHGMHTGPLKQAGGITERDFTATIDGSFDRISFDIDPAFGTLEQYVQMTRVAAAFNSILIDDIVPAHTGKGADWRLAERAYEDYPGLYHMVAIKPEDWALLPDVPEGQDVINLPAAVVDTLRDKRYIVGQLQRVIFYEPGVKETDWSVTRPIPGVDGIERRWVYLHYFKAGQPSLNWLDPSFAAQKLIIGDALHSLDVLGSRGLRLDANGFLGVERNVAGPAWSESHPLSITSNSLIAGMIRKAGGFSFQELNLSVDDIALMTKGGADLSYDFITRPAYHQALVSGDVSFLRLMLRTVHDFGIDPASLIHAMQNHDELTLELVHFWTIHANDTYMLRDQTFQGRTLRQHVRDTMYAALTGANAPYNQRFVTNGVACTTVSVIAAVLGITDLATIDAAACDRIKRIHLLLAMFNAFQPGVFALSGWDLVGALPLPLEDVAHLAAEGDTRWIERGGYDLVGAMPDAKFSNAGLPVASTLYGNLIDQLADPDSFASQLKKLLHVRQAYGLAQAKQLAIPDTETPSLLVMLHELSSERGFQLTALNFGPEPVEEEITLSGIPTGPIVDMIKETIVGDLGEDGKLRLKLDGYEGQSLRVVHLLPSAAGT